MASPLLGNCTPGYGTRAFINATGRCVCRAGYVGATCETVEEWYYGLVSALHALHGLVLVVVLAWAIALLANRHKRRTLRNLAGFTLGLAVTSALLRLVWLAAPSGEVTPFYLPTLAYATFYAALSALAPVLLLVASAVVMAFWVDLWSVKRQQRGGDGRALALHSKILLGGLSAATVIAAAVGIFLLDPITDFLLIFLPLVLNAILFAVYTALIWRVDVEGLSKEFRAKYTWAARVFVAMVVAWWVYTLTLLAQICLALFAGVVAPVRDVELLCHVFYRTFEPANALMVMLLIDPRAFVLRRAFCCDCAAQPSPSSSAGSAKSEGMRDTSAKSGDTRGTSDTGTSDTGTGTVENVDNDTTASS
jgi:hypothetical protein